MLDSNNTRAEPHPGVLGYPPRHELGVGLRQVEGNPLKLREGSDEEDYRTYRLQENVPYAFLGNYDLHYVKRAGENHHPEQGKDQRNLVGDHLVQRSETAQERILAVARPPREKCDDREEADDREDHDYADWGVREVRVWAKRDKREEGARDCHRGEGD